MPISRVTEIVAGLCILNVLGILVCTLWPFDFFAQNRVTWLEQTNGVRLRSRGVLVTQEPLNSTGSQFPNGPVTLEVWIEPSRDDSMFTILDVFQPNNHLRFRLQQYFPGLVVSHNNHAPNGNPVRAKVDVSDVLQRNKASFVTITSGTNGTSVYVNGKHNRTFSYFKISLQDFSGRLSFGNSAFHLEPWFGEVYGLAIYPREFTAEEVLSSYRNWIGENATASETRSLVAKYTFSERSGDVVHNQVSGGANLIVPKNFMVAQHSFLMAPWHEFEPTWIYFWDVLRNVVGFMPMGFFFCAWCYLSGRTRHAIAYSVLSGAVLSLSVEVLQAYIPQRESGITDIITNTSGAAIGALIAQSKMFQRLLTRRPAATSKSV
jgi:VanZ family protein